MAELQRYDIGKDVHYKKLVSSAGQKKNITAISDIYSEQGQKLVSKGTKIDDKVTAQLLKHKLQSPIDEHIEIENPISITTIINDIHAYISTSKSLTQLFDDLIEPESIESLIGSHKFPSTIAFKLSVAKSERTDIYDHALLILCLSHYIGCKAHSPRQNLIDTMLAALFHDIGLLHIDPDYFKDGRKLESEERRFLNVHVIISSLILQPYPKYEGTISKTVLDHHERLDGSGYPNGKAGNEICIPGQILAIAEVAASKFNDANECINTSELELLLNMNSKKLNPELYTHLSILYRNNASENDNDTSLPEAEIKMKLHQLAHILASWKTISSKGSRSSSAQFIARYIDTLYESLIQAGLNFESLDFLIMMIEQDSLMKQHTSLILKESSWQLSNLIEELKRRKAYNDAIKNDSLNLWLTSVEQFLIA
ncbi:MAG: HD domain-containing protein [Methylophaga sp.]|nr:HD domain-containing protein [Methylophaga sp.]